MLARQGAQQGVGLDVGEVPPVRDRRVDHRQARRAKAAGEVGDPRDDPARGHLLDQPWKTAEARLDDTPLAFVDHERRTALER